MGLLLVRRPYDNQRQAVYIAINLPGQELYGGAHTGFRIRHVELHADCVVPTHAAKPERLAGFTDRQHVGGPRARHGDRIFPGWPYGPPGPTLQHGGGLIVDRLQRYRDGSF